MYLDEPIIIIVILISVFNAVLSLLILNKAKKIGMGWFFWFMWLVLIMISILVFPYISEGMQGFSQMVIGPFIPFIMSFGLISVTLFFYHAGSVNYLINLISYMFSFFFYLSLIFFNVKGNKYLSAYLLFFFIIFELVLAIKTLWLHSKIKEENNKRKVTSNKTGTKRRVSPVQGNAKRPIRSVRAKRPPTRPK